MLPYLKLWIPMSEMHAMETNNFLHINSSHSEQFHSAKLRLGIKIWGQISIWRTVLWQVFTEKVPELELIIINGVSPTCKDSAALKDYLFFLYLFACCTGDCSLEVHSKQGTRLQIQEVGEKGCCNTLIMFAQQMLLWNSWTIHEILF